MIFQKDSKKAFLLPTKTGTHTTIKFLHNAGWKYLGGPHFLFDKYANEHPNLLSYTAYCFFRNPLERFVSGILHLKQMPLARGSFKEIVESNYPDRTIETITYDEVLDIFDTVNNRFSRLFAPQINWQTHSNTVVLDFDNFESELRRVSGNYELPIVRYNTSTDFGRSVVTQKVIDFVRQQYAADYALAKDRLGKEY
jgi:hypothetical protein